MYSLLVAFALVSCAVAQLPTNCGTPIYQPSSGGNKIVSNTEAVPYSWPWQVQMRYNGGHFCGGSIITNNYVLTASHCVYNRPVSAFSFRAGRHTRTGNDPYEQASAASRIVMHESYNPTTLNNDVTVVRLSTPFTFNNYVQPVCLTTSEPQAGTTVWVTGWGNVQGTCCDGRLKQARLPVITRTQCQNLWGSGNTITTGMLCAGNSNGYPSACNGDSGGPLVASIGTNKFAQVGIVSWGPNGCTSYQPNVYANVNTYRAWILSKLTAIEKEEAMLAGKFHPRLGAAFRAVAEALEEN